MAMDGTWPGMRTIGTATKMPDGGPMAIVPRLRTEVEPMREDLSPMFFHDFGRRYRLPEGAQDFIDSQSPGNSKTEGDSGFSD
jgi:hypothetical protein